MRSIASLQLAYRIWLMAHASLVHLCAIGYQPYAHFARLASKIFLKSLHTEFPSNMSGA